MSAPRCKQLSDEGLKSLTGALGGQNMSQLQLLTLNFRG